MEQQKKIILVAVDFNEVSTVAAKQACVFAKILGKSVVLLYVYHNTGFLGKLFTQEQNKNVLQSAMDELNKLVSSLREEYGVDIDCVVKEGSVHGEIVEFSEAINPRYLVIGTRSHFHKDYSKKSIGAIASKVIRSAKCPVITINSPVLHTQIRNILVPLDLTNETRQKVGLAIEIAQHFNSKMHVISALWSIGNTGVEYQLKAQLIQVQKVAEKAGLECVTEIIECEETNSIPVITEYIANTPGIDLLVIMTQQEDAIVEFFLGSTAQEMIRLSNIPVLSVVPKSIGNLVVGF
jgi:nucleotide-binding universal stress UspA family protein